ncbi:hypothetical protein MGYG_01391 [Nannizzia gypsea CBS 118893]|uniref:Uncharacterized protein n=1 Tax=Arthroderma gypseum (strain ATCC MYA-4604 / CBS 118893) TaxID=535722 RepID=E5R0L6_ARTGP|nr:hypothetical protein MGYG_01391 [Nannizzia gypsea CBS 118893]EFQ98360.1 hypothetical protein MGYG_01391 [Nannizzia gypsea CBS 118893]
MPRRSLRNSAPTEQRTKRQADTSSPRQGTDTKRRKSAPRELPSKPRTTRRASSTAKKSRYFEQDASQSDSSGSDLTPLASDCSNRASMEKDNETEDAYSPGAGSSASADAEESAEDHEEEDEDFEERKKRGSKKKPAAAHTKKRKSGVKDPVAQSREASKGKELWREGVRTGLEPGKEVFIKLPTPRDDGGIPYEDGTIHPNTVLFLADLKENNDHHDVDYRKSKKDWDSFVEALNEKLAEKDETIPELPAKDLVFRIYRDVRFSHDQTPYKPHFSAAWSRTGRKGPYAAYYLHLEPGKCFMGSGLWMPEASKLALIRQNIDRNSQRLKGILMHPDVRREILGGVPNDEKKVIKAFANQNKESALKTKPKLASSPLAPQSIVFLRSFQLPTPGTENESPGFIRPGILGEVIEP